MKVKIIALISLVVFLGLGCASMDLELTKMPMHSQFGKFEPRVPEGKCVYVHRAQIKENNDEFMVLAEYIVQERNQVSMSWDPIDMACHAFKDARKNGADAILIEGMDTKNVAQRGRTSAVVRLKAIRFYGQPPQACFQ
ncbi:MAG TPA: hypothetical protein VKO42_05310 [Patescibacteria group bacterium]|nr:hypothetical protein [Patescibacteria group bacterium]